jgi:SAM-dependent methyltransferase
MQYEPIKETIGRFCAGRPLMRKILYFLIDLLLLRAWHVNKALRKIAPQLPADASVLDAGSGLGQYSWRMVRMRKGWKIKGVDINSREVNDCIEFFAVAGMSDRVIFKTGDLTRLTDTACYDLILSVDVMEHIEDDLLVFKNFYRSLKENGTLLISTPSDKGGSDVHGHDEESFIDEHVRNGYSISDITEKLTAAGFSGVEAKYTYGKPGNISWRLAMKYPVKMLNASYFFFILLPFYYLVFFPVSLILNMFDVRMTHKSGSGLLVKAIK